MTLKGNLEVLNLSDIFQSLSLNKHTGTLVVTDGKREKLVYFSEGEIALFSSDRRLKIGELLIAAGKLAPEDLDYALSEQDNLASGASTQQLKIGEILVEEGFVTTEDIHDIVRSQIEEEIYDLFLWKKADFEFLIDYCPDKLRRPSCNVTTLQFNTNSLIMEAARRLDEWDLISREIPSLKEVYRPNARTLEVAASLDFPQHVRDEVALVDGYHTIDQIAEQAAISKFELCRFLYELKNAGAIVGLTPQELSDRADELAKQGRFREAAALYERLSELLPKNLSIRRAFAEMLKSFGDEKRALQQYELMTQQLETRRDRVELARIFKAMLEIEPDRKDIQERLRKLGRMGMGPTLVRIAAGVLIAMPIALVVAAWFLWPDNIRGLIAVLTPAKPEPVADAAELNAENLYQKGKELVRAGRFEEAWYKLKDLVDSYPRTGAAQQVRFPIEVVTEPAGKFVRLNGVPQGRTPIVAYYLPTEATLRLEIGDVDRTLWDTELDPEAFHRVFRDFRRAPKWTFATEGPVRGRPLVHRGVVYFTSLDGKLYGVRVTDQEPVLQISLRDGDADSLGEVVSAPVAVGDVVLVGTLDGSALSYDFVRRERRRRVKLSEEPLLAPPVVVGSLAVLSGYAGDVVAFDPAQNALVKALPLFANAVVAPLTAAGGNVALAASLDNRLLALEIGGASGLSVRWQFDAGDDLTTAPFFVDDLVLQGDARGSLLCLDANNGQVRWVRDLGSPVVGVTGARGFAAVTTEDGRLLCLDVRTGDPEWQARIGERVGAPMLSRRAVVVVTESGEVSARDFLAKGQLLWTGSLGARPGGPALVHEDLLFVGCVDGKLYCFGLEE